MTGRRPWFRREQVDKAASTNGAQRVGAVELRELSSVFSAPRWLRDLGFSAWYLVGAILLLIGLVWFLATTSTIVGPVVTGLILATVTTPIVTWLGGHRVRRGAAAALVLLMLAAIGLVVVVLVIGGIASQSTELSSALDSATSKVQSLLTDAGVSDSGATSAADSANTTIRGETSVTISSLAHGIFEGISGIASLALGLSFMLLSVFFLLKDGPSLRAAVDRHLGIPLAVAQTITGGVLTSLRRYFLGVTIVAAFNAIVVGVAALVLGVPLAGTIAIVTFLCAYVPFIGAFVAGAFAVVIALGSEGTTVALIMLVVVILANGGLQQIVQPIAFGATLGIHPLVVLIVTISGGCLFGMLGLVLAAPLTSAAVHITGDLGRARLAVRGDPAGSPEPPPEASAVPAI